MLLTGRGSEDKTKSDGKTNNNVKSDIKENNHKFNGLEVISIEKEEFEFHESML